jgi:Xaa-Pro dipeptidase
MTQTAFIPTFSAAEREQRWGRVRRRMTQEKLDCLIGFPNQGRFEQLQANTRYLTQIGGFATEVAVVFPLVDEVTAFVQSPGDVDFWNRAQSWIADVRCSRRLWGKAIIERLQEVKPARVGVIGLAGLMRAPEGVVPWTMFENVKAAFPNVEFVNATQITLEARAVKSAEEIVFIEKAEALAEAAVDAMFAIARRGVRENVLFAEMIKTMIAGGGELPTMIYWSAGQPGIRHLVPTPCPLEAGDVVDNEIEGKWAGYVAQIGAPAIVGPVPDKTLETYEAAARLFGDLCGVVRAGRKLLDVGRDYVEMVKDAGFQPAAWPLHGRGLGDDLPIMQNALAQTDAVFEEGHVLIFKPGMIDPADPDASNERVGDTVVVTKTGARRLGKRPLTISSIPL